MLGQAYERSFLGYIQAWFNVYGPLFFLCLYFWRQLANFLWEHQYFLVYLLITAILAFIGGGDVERFLFAASPVVLVLIGLVIQKNKTVLKWLPLAILLIITQAIAERVFWTLPDYPNDLFSPIPFLTAMTSQFWYRDLYITFGRHYFLVTALFEYFLLGILIFWMIQHRTKEIKQ